MESSGGRKTESDALLDGAPGVSKAMDGDQACKGEGMDGARQSRSPTAVGRSNPAGERQTLGPILAGVPIVADFEGAW